MSEQPTKEERVFTVPPITPEQQVWLSAWCAVAGAWNTKSKDVCAAWADKCLAD